LRVSNDKLSTQKLDEIYDIGVWLKKKFINSSW
jgi:hypothetical protein